MKSNYKRLGDFIRQVNKRNRGLISEDLRGLSMTKEFRKSTSNIVGTDLSNYKLVYSNQFACDFMSVIRVHKLPVVLHSEDIPVIVSPAYTVFEVKDESVLNSEYLMMWFRRSEFDRYADFRCDSAIRGGFKWEELCEVELPIPSIEKQREIVREFNTIVNRIQLNEQLIQKLEETAQAIYKRWFVEFEFPDENGLPYKSSGGKMVWCEELEKEVPEGWIFCQINSLCEITSSRRVFENEYVKVGIPFYRGKEISLKKKGEIISDPIFISEKRYTELISISGQPNEGDILMTAVGTIGSTYMVHNERFYFKDGNVVWFRNFKTENLNYYLYDFMQSEMFIDLINEITIGSTQSAITIKTFGEQRILLPVESIINKYSESSININKSIRIKKLLNENLVDFKNLILSKMTKVEENTEKEIG